MSLPRFYTPDLPSHGTVALEPSETQHASNSLRMSVGDAAILFNGQNQEAKAEVIEANRKTIKFQLEERVELSRELPAELTVVVALPKGDRQKSLVESLVQIGVHRLTPLQTSRSVAKANDKALERLQRWVIESCKQCGRNQLMHIAPNATLTDIVQEPPDDSERRPLFAHPYPLENHPAPLALAEVMAQQSQGDQSTPTALRVLIGPEGGLSESESALLADSGWQQFSLGPRILRVETAAICSVAQIAGYL